MPKTTDTAETTLATPASSMSDEISSTSERLTAAEGIVKQNVCWSMGCGAVPVPLFDLVGIGGLQLRMLKQLSDLYGVKFSEHLAKNIIAALIGTIGARALTVATVGSLIKTLPFAGALIGGVLAMPLIAGGSTYAIGRVFVRHFEMGGTFEDLNFARAKAYFSSQFRSGQRVAAEPVPASWAGSIAWAAFRHGPNPGLLHPGIATVALVFLLSIAYLAASMLVAFLGRRRKFGYWGYFFCSVLLTPVLGLLFVVASGGMPCPPHCRHSP